MKNHKMILIRLLQILAYATVLCLLVPSVLIFAQTSIMDTMQPISTETGANNKKNKRRAIKGTAYHHALSVDHKNGMEHSKALYHHVATDASINKQIVDEHMRKIDQILKDAKIHQAAVEKETAKERELIQLHSSIRLHHKKAEEHHKALQTEMEKQSPDPNVIKEHASGLYHELKGAESEHKGVKSKRHVPELTEPPVN